MIQKRRDASIRRIQSVHPRPAYRAQSAGRAAQLLPRLTAAHHPAQHDLSDPLHGSFDWLVRFALSLAGSGFLSHGGCRSVPLPCASGRRALASKRQHGSATKSTVSSARRFRRTKSSPSLTISVSPVSGTNLSYVNTGTVGSADADITVSLTEKHHPTDLYVERLRRQFSISFPGVSCYTLPVDMATGDPQLRRRRRRSTFRSQAKPWRPTERSQTNCSGRSATCRG